MFLSFLKLALFGAIACLVVIPFLIYVIYKSSSYIEDFQLDEIRQLTDDAAKLKSRIAELEAMLDYHSPEWHKKNNTYK